MSLMKHKYLCLYIGLMMLAFTSCSDDPYDASPSQTTAKDSTGVMVLTTSRNDGKLSIAIDAASASRSGVWIDLNGDGHRATDASEDVKTFDAYTDYTLPDRVRKVTIHGNVTYLGCAADSLTGIDVTGNPSLITLNCPQNKLPGIDLSRNISLQKLDCSENEIKSLDLSANTALLSLWCFNNQLTSLDVSGNSLLASLDCSGNQLSTLDVTKNTALERLLCYNNAITTLDLSNNEQLDRLWIFGNPFTADEYTRIMTALKTVAAGNLWVSEDQLTDALKTSIAAKGWTIQ